MGSRWTWGAVFYMMKAMRVLWLGVVLLSVVPVEATAQQTGVSGLIATARHLAATQQLDSAVVLLNRATDAASGGTDAHIRR